MRQSQRLLDAGIDRRTADFIVPTNTTPAWSLSALIALMPCTLIGKDGDEFHLVMHKWHDPEKDEDVYDISYDDYHNFSLNGSICEGGKQLLDVAVDLMEWLLLNGHVKFEPWHS